MINYQYQRWLKDIRARACSFESWKNDPAQQSYLKADLARLLGRWRGFLEAVSMQESWMSSYIFLKMYLCKFFLQLLVIMYYETYTVGMYYYYLLKV
jgi:hypothetical protein